MNLTLDKLRLLRREREYSQEYMAYRLDISQKAYSDIESGKTKLKNDILLKLSNIFEISPAKICPISSECSFHSINQDKHTKLVEYLLKNGIEFPSEYI